MPVNGPLRSNNLSVVLAACARRHRARDPAVVRGARVGRRRRGAAAADRPLAAGAGNARGVPVAEAGAVEGHELHRVPAARARRRVVAARASRLTGCWPAESRLVLHAGAPFWRGLGGGACVSARRARSLPRRLLAPQSAFCRLTMGGGGTQTSMTPGVGFSSGDRGSTSHLDENRSLPGCRAAAALRCSASAHGCEASS